MSQSKFKILFCDNTRIQESHHIYRDGCGNLVIADHSSDDANGDPRGPEFTDDGALWVDFSRPVTPLDDGYHIPGYHIPVRTSDERNCSTVSCRKGLDRIEELAGRRFADSPNGQVPVLSSTLPDLDRPPVGEHSASFSIFRSRVKKALEDFQGSPIKREHKVNEFIAAIGGFANPNALFALLKKAHELQPAPTSEQDRPMGLDVALEDLENDDTLHLYETEIGLFDGANDPNTAFESHTVVVAADSPIAASQRAQELCEEEIPVVAGVTFGPMAAPSHVRAADYAVC